MPNPLKIGQGITVNFVQKCAKLEWDVLKSLYLMFIKKVKPLTSRALHSLYIEDMCVL
jgi:hypothetical protein